jgi:copper chaperone
MTTTTFTVTGMICDHCVQSVKSEISKLPGVIEVDVDLGSGNVGVTSEGDVDSCRCEPPSRKRATTWLPERCGGARRQ